MGGGREILIICALVIDALQMTLGGATPGKGLLYHSDRGVPYAYREYKERVASRGAAGAPNFEQIAIFYNRQRLNKVT